MTDELVMVVPVAELFGAAPAFQGFCPAAETYLRRCLEGYVFMPRRRAEATPGYKQIIPYVVLQAPGGSGKAWHYMIFQRVQGGDPRLGRLYSIGLGGHVNAGDVLLAPVIDARATRTPVRRAVAAKARESHRLVRQLSPSSALRDAVEPLLGAGFHDHPLFRGIRRELREEVSFPPGAQLSLLGAINDDGNGVGQVHFGLAFLLQVPPTVKVRDDRKDRHRVATTTATPRERARIRLRREITAVQVGDLLPLSHIRAYRHAMESWSSLLLDSGVLPTE